ncbi:hypothetical protein M0805_009457 [Coniferiporia weirii]|nr:hypothetical protein M0805_009457 [Coniferiporia weirii]
MPEIQTGAQIFDIAFHPTESTVFVGLLTGGIKAFRYDEQGGQSEEVFSVRPSKRSCRGLATSEDGSSLFAVGKGKAMYTLDTATGAVTGMRLGIHQAPINRIKRLTSHLLSTGDDDGVVKLWDPRRPGPESVQTYTHHFDFISDFMWIEGKRQLVVTSGDGTLSVIDVRASKPKPNSNSKSAPTTTTPTPFAHSEDQEDELLSLVPIRGGEKTVVGTQSGVLAIFNRSSGWGDCVDRVPGHPHSIDALCTLPSSLPSSDSTILTGSSDGLLRAVQLFPTKLLGVVADHGAFPIERVAVDREGEGVWVGSVGHDEVVRMTDLREVFGDDGDGDGDSDGGGEEDGEGSGSGEDSGDEGAGEGEGAVSSGATDAVAEKSNAEEQATPLKGVARDADADPEPDSDSDSEPQSKKRQRKSGKKVEDVLGTDKKKKRRAKNDEVVADPSFFADL